MNKIMTNQKPRSLATLPYSVGLLSLVLAVVFSLAGRGALAAPLAATAPDLGAAGSYSALGKAGVTNTGFSNLSGNVGADSSITGFPPGKAGGKNLAPAVNGAEADASTADLALTAQAGGATPAGPNLTGATLVPGVYSVGSALLPGVLTLNGAGIYIFLASDVTASGSVSLTNGANACNVFWHVTSGAVITGGSFVGTIIAGTSITMGSGANLDGRALALTGNVTLISNSISGPSCATAPAATKAAATNTLAPVATNTLAPGVTAAPTNTLAPGATATAKATSVPGSTATVSALLPVTGADLSDGHAPVSRQWVQIGLGFLGLGLILLGFTLSRKRGV
jgi:hypothetical protein